MRTIGKGRSSVARALMSTIGATGSVKVLAAAGCGSGVGAGFGVGVGLGVGVGFGGGGGGVTGAATTISVVTDHWLIEWLIESNEFFTVIFTPSRKPRSALVTTYFAAMASAIWTHEAPVAGPRRHWDLAVGGG